MSDTPYRVGILGWGNVGAGVLALLSSSREECVERAGRPVEVRAVAVRDPSRERAFPADMAPRLTDDALSICRGDDIDLVVELVGGVEKPLEWIREALEHGKDVVTANKAVLAEHGEELFELAHKNGRRLLFEASVAGALPILQAIQTGLPAGPIERLTGILNGTSNHLLGEMELGLSLETALTRAQDLGLAEADPTLDISGQDAAHKLGLLARILSGQTVSMEKIRCEGIEDVGPEDLDYGARQGWVMKLVATYRQYDDGVALGVYPLWIDDDAPLATVRDEYNAVLLEGQVFGSMQFVGKGAGGLPTAGSVVADIVRAARGEGMLPAERGPLTIIDPYSTPERYWLRFRVPDRPGVLGSIAGALGKLGISIAAAEQPRTAGEGPVPIHIITHPVRCSELDQALREIDESGVVSEPTLRVRVEATWAIEEE